MSTEALASGRIESFPRGNSPPLRRPVTTGGDFAYQVPNPFLSSAPPNWAYRPEQDHRHQNDSYNSYSNLSMGSANGMNRPSTAPSFIPGFNGFPPPPALPSHQMLENIRRVSLPNSLPIDNFYGGGDESFENINEEEEIFDRGNQNNQNGGGPEEDGNYVPDNNYPDSN